jgi:hypothetical protein
MSSDILEPIKDDRGSLISLEMHVSGGAYLSMFDPNQVHGEDMDFHLTPDYNGLQLAKKIEDALSTWRDQVSVIKQ